MAGFGIAALLIIVAIVALVALPGWLAARGGSASRTFRDFTNTPAGNATEIEPPRSVLSGNRFCTECGSTLDTTAAFCAQCGSRV